MTPFSRSLEEKFYAELTDALHVIIRNIGTLRGRSKRLPNTYYIGITTALMILPGNASTYIFSILQTCKYNKDIEITNRKDEMSIFHNITGVQCPSGDLKLIQRIFIL